MSSTSPAAFLSALLGSRRRDARSVAAAGAVGLQEAAAVGRAETVALLAHPASARSANPRGETPLILAAKGGHDACVELLLPLSDINATCRDGRSALHHASARCAPKTVQLLLTAGADANMPIGGESLPGQTPLMLAGNIETVELLLPVSNPVAICAENRDALMHFVSMGRLDCALFLLDRGHFAVDLCDDNAESALSLIFSTLGTGAANLNMADRLIAAFGADSMAAHALIAHGARLLCEAIQRDDAAAFEWLLAHGVDACVNDFSANDEAPLLSAIDAMSKNPDYFDRLFPIADTTIQTDVGYTVLHWVAFCPFFDEQRTRLLAERADWSLVDNEEWTPLILAANNGREEIVELLLSFSPACQPDARDGYGLTALMRAIKQDESRIVELLAPHCDLSMRTPPLARTGGQKESTNPLTFDTMEADLLPFDLAVSMGHFSCADVLGAKISDDAVRGFFSQHPQASAPRLRARFEAMEIRGELDAAVLGGVVADSPEKTTAMNDGASPLKAKSGAARRSPRSL